jgi:PEGA domain
MMMARTARFPRWRPLGAALGVFALSVACLRAAVTLTLTPGSDTPNDAKVTIDEQFVGLLGFVAARGVRLPEGEHRITVEREGYFPYDRIVVSDREPIRLDVRLQRLPD